MEVEVEVVDEEVESWSSRGASDTVTGLPVSNIVP